MKRINLKRNYGDNNTLGFLSEGKEDFICYTVEDVKGFCVPEGEYVCVLYKGDFKIANVPDRTGCFIKADKNLENIDNCILVTSKSYSLTSSKKALDKLKEYIGKDEKEFLLCITG